MLVLFQVKSEESTSHNKQCLEERKCLESKSKDVDATSLVTNKVLTKRSASTLNTKDTLTIVGKKIQQLRIHYLSLSRLGGKSLNCYSRYCNLNDYGSPNKMMITAQSLVATCYSPLCLKKIQLKKELVALVKKANFLNSNQNSRVTSIIRPVISNNPELQTRKKEIVKNMQIIISKQTETKTIQKTEATSLTNTADAEICSTSSSVRICIFICYTSKAYILLNFRTLILAKIKMIKICLNRLLKRFLETELKSLKV